MLRSGTNYFLKFGKTSFGQHIVISSKQYSGLQYEAFEGSTEKTTIDLATKETNLHPLFLKGYGVGIFKFSHATIKGSIAVVDKAVFKWNITDPKDITTASLSMFQLVYPKLDIVIVGTGNSYYPVDPHIIHEMKERGIAVEVQGTRQACGTYNLLKTERPELVGAALIPISETMAPQKMIHRGRRDLIE